MGVVDEAETSDKIDFHWVSGATTVKGSPRISSATAAGNHPKIFPHENPTQDYALEVVVHSYEQPEWHVV